jgi:hypothetical protein
MVSAIFLNAGVVLGKIDSSPTVVLARRSSPSPLSDGCVMAEMCIIVGARLSMFVSQERLKWRGYPTSNNDKCTLCSFTQEDINRESRWQDRYLGEV